jgi:hypothetical protein
MLLEAVQFLGLAELGMIVKPDGPEICRPKVAEIRFQIEQLDGTRRPKLCEFGRFENISYDCPMPPEEIHGFVAGYWYYECAGVGVRQKSTR